jgi:hypothetical protein
MLYLIVNNINRDSKGLKHARLSQIPQIVFYINCKLMVFKAFFKMAGQYLVPFHSHCHNVGMVGL